MPTVAFKETGFSDIIEHKVNGYLSNYLDDDDFTKGIEWILNYSNDEDIFSNCLKVVNNKFGQNLISKKYIELYKSILQ